jgi:hypothetical protein
MRSLKGPLRKIRTDPALLDHLLSSESKDTFRASEFEAQLGLRALPSRRIRPRRIEDVLGPFEQSERDLKQAQSLMAELDILLPPGIPTNVYEPLRYFLARLVAGGILDAQWEKPSGPHWLRSLLALYVVSEVTGTKPWWLQSVHQAVHEQGTSDPVRLGRGIVEAASRSMNVVMSPLVREALEKISGETTPQIGRLRSYMPKSGEYGTNTLRALSYVIRESFLPSFKRLGLCRVLVLSGRHKAPNIPRGNIAEEIQLRGGPFVSGRVCLLPQGSGNLPEGAICLGEERTSLRMSLLDRSTGIWSTVLDFSKKPALPKNESDWLIHEERRSRRALKLTEREALVIGTGWAFETESNTRERVLLRLGVSSLDAKTSQQKLLRKGAFTIQYRPAEELLGLGDEVIALIQGGRNSLMQVRAAVEAGVPWCESSFSVDEGQLLIRTRVGPYSGQLVATQLSRQLSEQGIEAAAASLTSSSLTRFASIVRTLQEV